MTTDSDTYRTVRSVSKGIFRDKGSKFIAHCIPVRNTDDVKTNLEGLRSEYHDARHHCYAYMIGSEKSEWRVNDDGEPSGTAGKPILGQINSNNITNVLVVVVRYFGGTLLGVSGLINAYKQASSEAIRNSDIIECTVNEYYRIEFPYSAMNDVMRIIKDENMIQSEQNFALSCSMKIGFRLSRREQILPRLQTVQDIKIEYFETS